MKLTFILGYGASMLHVMHKILKEESKELGFDFLAVSDFSSEEYANKIAESDAIFIYAYELPDVVEKAIENSKAKIVVSASDNHIHLSRGPSDVLNMAIAYFKTGGEANLRNLVRFMLKNIGLDIDVEDVCEVPWHGIYHPKLGVFTKTEEYLQKYDRRPLVGVLIHRSYWLYGNTEHFEAVVEALESERLGVLPVFTHGWKDAVLNTPTKEDSIREFFFLNGKPVVDAVINLTYFFLLDHGRAGKKERFRDTEGVRLLKMLNVPIIQPCFSSSQNVGEWKENPQGIYYLSQIYTIIMPEVDGLIEPIYLAGTKINDEGVKTFKVYREHARYIAQRVRRWIELRRKKPEERRIAIILINPPCKSLEASVAVGFGLDVPESIVRLLHKLKEDGYRIENPPEDGNGLIKLILERKAISEFRWTSVEEIVEKGGAVEVETRLR